MQIDPPPARAAARRRLQAAARRLSRPAPPTGSAAQIETELRSRLLTPMQDSGRAWVIWLVAGAVTVFAAAWRLVELGRPARLVFDETYYVKQAYSLLHLGYEGRWAEEANVNFAAGTFTDLSTQADYVVHPAVGKWMIAAGMAFFDPADPVGWRIAGAVTGALSVLIVVLIARHLFGHIAFGAMAGLLVAVDGIHLVMSRIAILDIFLSFWALLGFAALLLDRRAHRTRLARQAASVLAASGRYPDGWGVTTGVRWWLLVAGICLGLATGVKWSGAYFLAVFGLLAVAWNITARRAAGVPLWVGAGVLRDGVPAFLTLVPTAAATYLATWIPWLATPGSYMRHWAGSLSAEESVRPWLPDWLNSLVEYHLRMWDFHTGLTSEHTYMASPLGWLIQWRPTSFAWQEITDAGAEGLCAAQRCSAAILAVGNPVLWWGGALALVVVVWHAVRRADWRAWAVLAGYAAGYLPWLGYMHRTIFTFYTVAFVPFVAFALVYLVAVVIGPRALPVSERRFGVHLGAGITAAALLLGAYFWPIWTSKWVPHWFWQAHMFLRTWI